MIEKSGSSKYSSTRIIQIDNLLSHIRIYPNPAQSAVTMSFMSTSDQTATLRVRTISGTVVMSKPISLNTGDNRTHIPLNNLSNGLYLVELITSQKVFTNKLTVSN